MSIRQTYKRVAVDEIQPHPENPNRGDVDAIRASIEVNGWFGAIIYQKSTGNILVGEHRWRAAKAHGMTEVDAFERDCDDLTAISIMLGDNETAARAQRDNQAVAVLLERLDDAGRDLSGTAYDLAWLENVEETGSTEGVVPLEDVPEFDDWESKYGVIVECADESEQQAVYESLVAQGMTCRVVTA